MKKLSKRILSMIGIVLLLSVLVTGTILAATVSSPVQLANTVILEGLNVQPDNNNFYAVGRHWVFYLVNNAPGDGDIVYRSALALSPNSWSVETVVVADTVLYGPEFAVWYDLSTNTVHYARHNLSAESTVYRMGTPNIDGTIT